jgi:hypothetical protein
MKVYLYRCSWDLLWDSEKRNRFEEIGVQWCLERDSDIGNVEKLLITTEKIYLQDIIEPTEMHRPLLILLGENYTEYFPLTQENMLITRTLLYKSDSVVGDVLSKISTANKNGLGYISEDFEEFSFIYSIIGKNYSNEEKTLRIREYIKSLRPK